jgi:hypothetical protein
LIVRRGYQKIVAFLPHRVVILRPVPVKLHDRNSKSKCCDAEAEGVELYVHGNKTDRYLW